jgi:hypothetical protein
MRQLALPLTAPSPDRPPESGAPAPPALRFIRRRGTRRYILRVLDDGSLRVTLPWWGSQREARAFVASQAGWIARQRAQFAEAPDRRWRAGDQVLVNGEPWPLRVGPSSPSELWCGDERVGTAPADGDLRPVVERWLRAGAADALRRELAALAGAHAVTVARVTIRNQQSLWGSCSRHGAIALNWRLVQVPPFVREYVLVHELMHRRELNHSARFWRHVAAACPRYVEARRWLRLDGARLF